MKDKIIKVGYLVSYDWKLLENSIPRIYEESDLIVLALDKNRKTWAGNTFAFDEDSFTHFIKRIDSKSKISIYEDNFFEPSFSTMENEVRERNMLAKKMGSGGWHIQIDADEYLIDFASFVKTLKTIDPNPDPAKIDKPVNVTGNWITIVKRLENGCIYVKPNMAKPEVCVLATQIPNYVNGRNNGYFNISTSLLIIHESRSRTDEEFYFKLKNWGHNTDFDTDSYYNLWKAIDGYNFKFIKDFNPMDKKAWPELDFAPAKNVDELIAHIKGSNLERSKLDLLLKNSRNLARLKKLLSVLLGR